MVENRQFLEAIEQFYAPRATMQENGKPPRTGLPALLENERKMLGSVQEWHVCRAESSLLEGINTAIHWVFEFTDKAGHHHRLDEVALQEWSGDKIMHERFFYDPNI